MKQPARYFVRLCTILTLSALAWAKSNPERTQFNRDIRIEPDEKVGDATCLNCNVYVRGQVAGDVTTVHGNIVVDKDAVVTGDVTTVLGDARIEKGANISGELTIVGGVLHRQPGSTVSGDVTNFENKSLVVSMMLSPLIVLGIIIALIVWLVQRGRRARPIPASPPGFR